MNLVAVALNCTSDEYLHNITWSNISQNVGCLGAPVRDAPQETA